MQQLPQPGSPLKNVKVNGREDLMAIHQRNPGKRRENIKSKNLFMPTSPKKTRARGKKETERGDNSSFPGEALRNAV